jgi:outer membrane protein OmpA-like peptidoglycan-associated protein
MADVREQATGIKGDGLRKMVIMIGTLALLAAGIGAAYSVRSSVEEVSAGANVAPARPAATPTAMRAEAPMGPRAVAPASPDGQVVHADIYFDFKSTRLRADAVRMLQEKAGIITSGEAWVVLIQGYADQQGPVEYNRSLAQRRAHAVKQFLVELGVPEASIKLVTIGPEGAICDDPGKECQQLNRRVHLEIRKLGPAAAAASRVATAALLVSQPPESPRGGARDTRWSGRGLPATD